jgi:diacylglycerol kinase (ATP)
MDQKNKNVILNANSKGGRGVLIWRKIQPVLQSRYGPFSVTISNEKEKSEKTILRLIRQGERVFIAAGGDGGVNHLVNTIIAQKKELPLSKFVIGALGLGSSNDFHKPFLEKVGKVPVRMNDTDPALRDVGEIVCRLGEKERSICFLVSASAGIVAEGNANFNRDGKVLNFLKKRSTDLAIFWTFFRTLRSFRNVPLTLVLDGRETFTLPVSYLAVSKTPYISGMIRFDEKVSRNDGRFMVKVLYDCTKWGQIRCLAKLTRGIEQGIPNLLTRFARTVEISAPHPFTLECDGETLETRHAFLRIFKEKIRECA